MFLAVAVSVGTLEVVMPCFDQLSFVFTHDGRDAIRFGLGESVVVLHSNRRQPELRKFAVSLYVNMGWLASVAREEEKPIRPTLKDGRTHRNDSANFSDSPPILIDGPVCASN
jgi:hypothetical protein